MLEGHFSDYKVDSFDNEYRFNITHEDNGINLIFSEIENFQFTADLNVTYGFEDLYNLIA